MSEMTDEKNLENKLNKLAVRVARIEAVADFLTKHKGMASRCTLKQLSTGVGLYFEDKAYLRPVGDIPVALQLENHVDNDAPNPAKRRIMCADVVKLTDKQLAQVFAKVKIKL
ncbi:hypothetical protein RBB79_11175 [Tunturiibacter empetritectus]|uniref:Uncharacterized protein n=1 Tax=Tunturiibacter lichenicola TaxID=2051959 RepID=A0A852VFW6_9BACT|nr:hypothetical protein [Edaphobacter lichenicola]NYF90131.1 hypothetical protein [Edaphobacter lichenicola]